jgi:hypothetical protein
VIVAVSVAPWPVGIWATVIAIIVFACWALGSDRGLAKDPDPPAQARREIDALEKLYDES